MADNFAHLRLNKSMNLEDGGKFENFKLRISCDYILIRNKTQDKQNKDKNILKGKYEMIEDYDPNFMEKLRYDDYELYISTASSFKLNEKNPENNFLIQPPNLRKDQKDEKNIKLYEKLQGNFIDESITKITKINWLERMRQGRIENSQMPNKELIIENKNIHISPIGSYSNGFFNNNNFNSKKASFDLNTINNSLFGTIENAEKKIGNSKVLFMENNFVISNKNINLNTLDEDHKMFYPFESIEKYGIYFS